MYIKIGLPLQLWMFSILTLCFIVACSNEPDAERTDVGAVVQKATTQTSIAADYFSAVEMGAIIRIKSRFDEGLRQSFEKRTVGYAYSQNALRMRLNYIEGDQANMPFPFNGTFSLEEVSEDVDKLTFVSKKCGFLIGNTKEQVNYYCLALNENYFDYLEAIPNKSSLITTFIGMYKERKEISPEFRQQLLLTSTESLDLDNWDHQFFYMLAQCWRNEELIGYFKADAKNPQLSVDK